MPTRLNLEDNLLPIQAFFNAVSNFNFLKVIKHLLHGIGYTVNDVGCTFPTDLDPGEALFEGVRFSLFEEKIVISVEQLHLIIRQVCKVYCQDYPDEKCHCEKLLEEVGLTL